MNFGYVLLAILCVADDAFAALGVEQQTIVDAVDSMIADMSCSGWHYALVIAGTLVSIVVWKRLVGALLRLR